MYLRRLAVLLVAALVSLIAALPSGATSSMTPGRERVLQRPSQPTRSVASDIADIDLREAVSSNLRRVADLLGKVRTAPQASRAGLLRAAFDAAGDAETPLLDAIDRLGDRAPAALRKAAHDVAGIQAGIAKAQFAERVASGKFTFPVRGKAQRLNGPFGQHTFADGSAQREPQTRIGTESGLAYPVGRQAETNRRDASDPPVPSSINTPAGSVSTDPGLPTPGTVTDAVGDPGKYVCETDQDICSARPANTFLAGQALILNAEVAVGTYLNGTSRRYLACVMAVGVDSPNSSVGDTRTVLFSGATDCPTNNVATYGQSGAYEFPKYSNCPQAGSDCVSGTKLSGWTCFCGGVVDTGAHYFYRNSDTQFIQTESWLSMAINAFVPNGTDNRWTYTPLGCDAAGSPIVNCAIFSLVPFGFIPDFDQYRTPGWALGIVNGVLAQVLPVINPVLSDPIGYAAAAEGGAADQINGLPDEDSINNALGDSDEPVARSLDPAWAALSQQLATIPDLEPDVDSTVPAVIVDPGVQAWRLWDANETALDQAAATGRLPDFMWVPLREGLRIRAEFVPTAKWRGSYGPTLNAQERKFCDKLVNAIICMRIHDAEVFTDANIPYYWSKKQLAADPRGLARPNASRHCTWIGVLSTRVADGTARDAGRRHEDHPRAKGQSRWEYVNAKAMDLHNNETGIQEGDAQDPEFNEFPPGSDKAEIAGYLMRRCVRRAKEDELVTNLWWLLPHANFPTTG